MLEFILKFAAIASLAITAIATYITVRNNTRQLGAQIFLAYSDRVGEIRQSASAHAGDPEGVAVATFLIFDFYELKRRGYVSRAIWSIWDRDIADLLRTDHFRKHWDNTRARFQNHPHFLKWVEAQLRWANAEPP